jgi:hypothetical protein
MIAEKRKAFLSFLFCIMLTTLGLHAVCSHLLLSRDSAVFSFCVDTRCLYRLALHLL